MAPKITITKLDPTDKDLILKIANWYYEEWNTPIEKTIRRLTNQPNGDVLFQLVLAKDNEVVATGGLCNNVNILKVHEKLRKFKPWLALLYTAKDYRNQGLGKMLLEQIERCAKEEKLSKIYLYTFTAESLYRRCGWKQIDRVHYKGHDTVVMEKGID
jgi:GNAT superfamily N-acetyltransferase